MVITTAQRTPNQCFFMTLSFDPLAQSTLGLPTTYSGVSFGTPPTQQGFSKERASAESRRIGRFRRLSVGPVPLGRGDGTTRFCRGSVWRHVGFRAKPFVFFAHLQGTTCRPEARHRQA